MLSVWMISGQNLKKTFFLWVEELGLIYYLLIFLCLFRKYLSVATVFFWVEKLGLIHYLVICLCFIKPYYCSKLNCLLVLLILSLSVVFWWFFHPSMIFRFSIKTLLQSLMLFQKHVSFLTIFHDITFFVFHNFTEMVRFFNRFSCNIFLGIIQRFFVLFSQSLNIQTSWSLQGW